MPPSLTRDLFRGFSNYLPILTTGLRPRCEILREVQARYGETAMRIPDHLRPTLDSSTPLLASALQASAFLASLPNVGVLAYLPLTERRKRETRHLPKPDILRRRSYSPKCPYEP